MTVKNFEEDGSNRTVTPLNIVEEATVVAHPDNSIISLHLSQPQGKHHCQWGMTLEQAAILHRNLGKALRDCRTSADR